MNEQDLAESTTTTAVEETDGVAEGATEDEAAGEEPADAEAAPASEI
jgi:hypothetical protein